MKFAQIMEVSTGRFDELESLHERWRAAAEGRRTVKQEWVMRDRANPDRYVIMVLFDSYEDAMTNNDLPETNENAANMASLVSAPTIFRNFDLVRVDAD